MTSINSSGINQIKDLCGELQKCSDANGAVSNVDLEGLFSDVNYYNSGEDGKKEIDEQIKTLEGALKALRSEAEQLQKEIDKENFKADGVSNDLADKINEVNKKTGEYQKGVKSAAKTATVEAIAQAKKGGNFKSIFGDAFEKALKKIGVQPSQIAALYKEISGMQNTLDPIMNKIDMYAKQVGTLETKLNSTNSTIKLLEATKANLSSTMEGAYKNVDTDGSKPIFSGKKAELANGFLEQYQSRFSEDVAPDKEGANKADTSAVQDKWKAEHKGKYTSGDKYAVESNPELANLRQLHKDGMLEDLQKSGMSVNEIMEFVSSNWDVGIKKTADGNGWVIPNGHSKDAWVHEPVFDALEKLCKNPTKAATADDVNQQQFAEMQKAVNDDKILDKMYEAGFTFKEAMYTLTTLFPDAGISYDIGDQKERNYGIAKDTEASNGLYKYMSETILDHWNVGDSPIKTADDDAPTSVTKSDPIVFQDGETTWTFITDRDDNGKFDYTDGKTNDLLGSEKGIEELFQYDYNGDGKIDANDVDEDGNKALDKMLLMGNRQEESIANKEDVDGYKKGDNYKEKGAYTNSVDFNIKYTTASDLGITSIDLADLQRGEGAGEEITSSTKGYDGAQEAKEDINGSDVINTFKITKDGKEFTGKETLNTDENLETFYKQVADSADTNSNKIYSKISEEEFKNIIGGGLYNDDAKATAEILEAIKQKLEAAKEANKDYKNPEEYMLSMSYEEFLELFGEQGTYIKDVREVAANKASEHKNDAAKVDLENGLYYEATEDVGKAVDDFNKDFNEKHKIELIKKENKNEEK